MCEIIKDISKEIRAVREIGFQRLQKSTLNICYEGPVGGGEFGNPINVCFSFLIHKNIRYCITCNLSAKAVIKQLTFHINLS